MKLRLFAIVTLLALSLPALGYIEALTSLKGVFPESDVVARGVIDAANTDKKVAIVKVVKTVKGKCSYERIRINLGAATEAWQGDSATKHAVVGAPVSVFYHKAENSDKAAIALIYNNRFWMTVQPDEEMWRLQKIELAMNRVFHGTAEELNELAVKILSGKSKPPAPNAELKPYTKEILDTLPLPPKEGEKWPEFDAAAAFKK